MRTQAALSPVRKSIRRLAIGAAGPSRDPTAVKRNDVQELAVKIPLCEEGNLVRPHPAGEENPYPVMPALGHIMPHPFLC